MMDTPQPNGITPRQQYQEAQKHGLPTPLDSSPQYPDYFENILNIFWDIMLYKSDYDKFVPLSLIDSYQRLFDVTIHPFVLFLILRLDRQYTLIINNTLQERQPQE